MTTTDPKTKTDREDAESGAVAFGCMTALLLIAAIVLVIVAIWTTDPRWAVTGVVLLIPAAVTWWITRSTARHADRMGRTVFSGTEGER